MKHKLIILYLDDVMIHSCTLAEHVIHVRQVLTLLTVHALKAKNDKCASACQKVYLCGIYIYKDGFHAHEYKTCTVINRLQPDNNKNVRGFLGLTSYYRKFIEHYAHIAMLLNPIGTPPTGNGDFGWRRGEPRKGNRTPFPWDSECQYAFDTLKTALCEAPVLALPDPQVKYCLHLHASQYASGAVLPQVQDKIQKVLSYFSRKLDDAETQYPRLDRQLLGIRNAIAYWKFNLNGTEQPFLVHTEHATMHWILTQTFLTV
jgi:hypothetical protein